MSIWTDLQAAIEAKITTLGYTGTLANLGIDQPFSPTLANLMALQAQLGAITNIGGGGGGGGVASTVTANAGTNLNTSALALESGGNLAGINTRTGDVIETAPSSDIASSGLNGRLQRIAQRLSFLIALFPSSLGAKTAANSLAVTLSTDGVASGIAVQIGEVQGSPTANTLLFRLKAITDALAFGIKAAANSISITPANDALFAITGETGFLNYRNPALTNAASQIKATAGQTRGWNFINLNTVPVYVKFYDALAANVVVGSTTLAAPPLAIPSGGAFYLETQSVSQYDFLTAISISCVTGLADSNATAPTIPIHAGVRYK